MKKILFLIMALIASSPLATAKDKTVELCILETSDVHGSFFPYDFINRTPCKGSLARLSTYVKRERERFGDNLLLLDNGDILQGQPTVYGRLSLQNVAVVEQQQVVTEAFALTFHVG